MGNSSVVLEGKTAKKNRDIVVMERSASLSYSFNIFFFNYCAGFCGFLEIVLDGASLIKLCGSAPAHLFRRPDC